MASNSTRINGKLLALLALLLACALPAHAQSLGMLLQAGLVPGLEGRLLRLQVGPITAGQSTDVALLPAVASAPGGVLLGSGWGDLVFYASGAADVCRPPQVWLGAEPADWQWPPVARQVSPEIADWEGNGQLDLILGWGNLLLWYPRVGAQMGAGQQVRLADGRALTEVLAALDPTAGHLAPCIGDVDGDGKPDLILGADDGTLWWARNTADHGFSLEAPQRLETPTGAAQVVGRARPAWGDVTGDGRPDLLVGDARGLLTLWPGMPTGLGPGQPLTVANLDPPFLGGVSPRLAADGRILVGESGGFVRALGRGPDGTWLDRGRVNGEQVPLAIGSAPAISAVDENGDGRLELLAGEAGGRVLIFHPRAGAPAWDFDPAQTLTIDGKEPVEAEGGYSWPLLVDIEGSGTKDLLLGTGAGRVELWLRARTLVRGSPLTAGAGPIQTAGPLSLAVADWSGNGRPDLFVGCHAQPAVQAGNLQVAYDQVGLFLNEALSRGSLPIFTKGTLLDIYCRRPQTGATLGLLHGLGLSGLFPLPTPPRGPITRFLGLGERATYLFDCESQPPFYPMLTLPLADNAPPQGVLPALYSVWVTSDAAGRPDQVLCGLREYGMVCMYSAESLGLR
jgi:hypothetical protein